MVRDVSKTQQKAAVLIEALPFIKRFAGQMVCIKVGGELFQDLRAAKVFADDIAFLHSVGVQVVLLHGGGPQISKAMKHFGKEPEFIDGQRVTDEHTLEITAMVLLGDINRKIVGLLNQAGARAIGLSGVDDSLIQVSQKDPKLGFVGSIIKVNAKAIKSQIDLGYIPVIAGMGVDDSGQLYNVNADVAASKVAVAVKACKLIVLTNVEGLYESFGDEDSLISETDTHGLIRLISENKLSEGMIPKIESILMALKAGVPRAHILDGRKEHAVLLEIFTPEGIGTMVRTTNQELL